MDAPKPRLQHPPGSPKLSKEKDIIPPSAPKPPPRDLPTPHNKQKQNRNRGVLSTSSDVKRNSLFSDAPTPSPVEALQNRNSILNTEPVSSRKLAETPRDSSPPRKQSPNVPCTSSDIKRDDSSKFVECIPNPPTPYQKAHETSTSPSLGWLAMHPQGTAKPQNEPNFIPASATPDVPAQVTRVAAQTGSCPTPKPSSTKTSKEIDSYSTHSEELTFEEKSKAFDEWKHPPIPKEPKCHSAKPPRSPPLPMVAQRSKDSPPSKSPESHKYEPESTSRASQVCTEHHFPKDVPRNHLLSECGLLFTILNLLEPGELVSMRLVSKPWDMIISAILDLPISTPLGQLLTLLGPVRQDHNEIPSTIMLDFNIYQISSSKLSAFSGVCRATRKLDLDLSFYHPVETSAVDAIHMIGSEIFMALTILCKKVAPSQSSFFNNLQELIVGQELFSMCSYAFTPMFLPPSIRILTLKNWGRFNIQTVFGYLSSVAPHIQELKIFSQFITSTNPFETFDLEVVPGIRSLECIGLTNGWGFLAALARGCPNLERLHVNFGYYHGTETAHTKWRKVRYPALKTLNFLGCSISQESEMVSFLRRAIFGSLSSVEIEFPRGLWTETISPVLGALSSNSDSLQSLQLSLPLASSTPAYHASWSSIHFQFLLGLKNLQYLKLRGPFGADDDQFKLLCQGLTQLKSLILEGETTSFTVDALRCCDPDTDYPLTNLTIPINGSEFSKHGSLMELPGNLKSLSIYIYDLQEDKTVQLAAAISSACPGNASVSFSGSSPRLISSLESVFYSMHAWRRQSETRTMKALESFKGELRELREMYQQVVAERDVAIQERKTLEVLIGSVCSED
ncbi:hypothetical protein FRC02_000843 [Tulasnella sp. 418]|nr:hypothetical protein FRC02_000843 [Tulasnella sp. 418]